MPDSKELCNTTDDALAKLEDLVRAGIAHGHFQAQVFIGDATGGRTEVIITAGKQYRYVLQKQ